MNHTAEPMYILIDNYDSFTYNLYHYLVELGVDVKVWRNDQISVEDVISKAPRGIIVSPGPCSPNEAGICLDLVKAAKGKVPVLGVCLGHQSIGQAFGGEVVRAPYVMHGKTSMMSHKGTDIFKGLPSPYLATRYHSLIIDRSTLPDCFEVTAESDDGLIMGLRHKNHDLYGVQFHPESIASDHGHALLKNFLDICEAEASAHV
jgi:anthranilate synthase component 2